MSDALIDGAKLEEMRQRLINIEIKVDRLDGTTDSSVANSGYGGHPDQVFGPATYAQHGDDLVVLNIFHNIGISRPSYMDIGAHHPINISNTALLYKLGCRGINIEPNPNLFENFKAHRQEDRNLNIGIAKEGGMLDFYMIDDFSGRNTFDKKTAEDFVRENPMFAIRSIQSIPVKNLNDVVSELGGEFPDFLTLDVEGLDYAILESFDFSKSRPKVVCVEFISGDGSSAHAGIKSLMLDRGYFLYFKTVGNAFYVHNDFKALLD
ncbi:MAG: FkbM family methyltransferase [Proteobacteria bacterium]|nr:FkbM family methyltransferase [Pseudomonadota bacterium]